MTKKFGPLVALDNIDLDIEEGELFGLLGPNGAGKTTLISILSTILQATSGTASVCGFDVQRKQADVRRSIGVVFQDPTLDVDLTGEENLDFHGRLYGMRSRDRKKRIDLVLNLVDLKDRRNNQVKTYSGGMRRRLEIARGLMHAPRVLFLDEPTLGLDPQTRRKIWAYIQDLKQTYRMTVILTTHYMEEADQLCTRIAIIDQGKIVSLDSPDTLKESLGGDLLELGIAQTSEKLITDLEADDDVSDISVEDSKLILTVRHGESFIPRMVDLARTYGVEIRSVSMRRPNLEDVFIKLTGREIRDDAVTESKQRIRIFLRQRMR